MGLKDFLFESSGEEKKQKPEEPATAVPAAATVAVQGRVEDTDIYKKLLARTDYTTTPVGETIHKYLDALSTLPLDDLLKLKTAVAQAKKLDGVRDEGILGMFEVLSGWLLDEEEKFSESASEITAKDILQKEQAIKDYAAEIEKLLAQVEDIKRRLAALSTEVAEAKSHLSNVAAQFKAALTRRRTELDAEKARFAAALKG